MNHLASKAPLVFQPVVIPALEHISWEDLDSFVFVPVALIPQVPQDDHLQVQNHHDCTRIANDSSGDLEDDHLQVQIHHD